MFFQSMGLGIRLLLQQYVHGTLSLSSTDGPDRLDSGSSPSVRLRKVFVTPDNLARRVRPSSAHAYDKVDERGGQEGRGPPLPGDHLRKSKAEVVRQPLLGVARPDLNERVRKVDGRTPGHAERHVQRQTQRLCQVDVREGGRVGEEDVGREGLGGGGVGFKRCAVAAFKDLRERRKRAGCQGWIEERSEEGLRTSEIILVLRGTSPFVKLSKPGIKPGSVKAERSRALGQRVS